MDTHGHHRVLQQGAEARLRRSFAEKSIEGWNTNALFLGNWLADLSQVNDPGSTLVQQISRDLQEVLRRRAAVTAGMTTTVITALAQVAARKGVPGTAALERSLRGVAEVVRVRADEMLTAFGGLFTGGPATGQPIGIKLVAMVRALGYLKFALPESNQERLTIPYRTYARIFDELCRQYYPHEHVDRPLCSASYGSVCEQRWGEQYQAVRERLYASGRSRSGNDPHMYDYLVDDRRIIAARLAELDLGWAGRDLPTGVEGSRVTPAERDLSLARLGHILHAVEDFFAHSTFVEHAVFSAGGVQAVNDAIYRRSGRRVGEHAAGAQLASSKVIRRLQRYDPALTDPDARGAREDALVTGYFDGWDTLNSGLHFIEELFRPKLLAAEKRSRLGTVGEFIKAALATYADATVDDVLELFGLLAPPATPSWDVRVHQAMDGLITYVEAAARNGEAVSSQTVAQGTGSDPLLAALDPAFVREVLTPAVIGVAGGARELKTGWTIYQAVKACGEFYENPVGYLLKPMLTDRNKSLATFVLKLLAELVLKDLVVKLNYVVLTELQSAFRADRVGCHSLLAKDQPTEPLFDEMFSCARHVDWFIVDTLCRWSDPDWLAATPPHRRWVRWDELLAHYLRSPLDVPRATRRRMHWRRARDLRREEWRGGGTLEGAYARMAATGGGGAEPGAYADFLAVNLGLESATDLFGPVNEGGGYVLRDDLIERLVVLSGLATPTARGYELVPGVTLALPVYTTVPVDIVEVTTWYTDVLGFRDDGAWLEAALAYEKSRWSEQPEFAHHRLTFVDAGTAEQAQREVVKLIDVGADLRKKLEAAYR